MATFTEITEGLDWQDVDFINELWGGVKERQDAVGSINYSPAKAEIGDDVQSATAWQLRQLGLESVVYDYLNHTIDPVSSELYLDNTFTLETWREVADLPTDGFRRATVWDGVNEPVYSYGQMQIGDIIGPWIFEDLQKGIDALRWVGDDEYTSGDLNSDDRSGLGTGATCALARSTAVTNFANDTWAHDGWDGYEVQMISRTSNYFRAFRRRFYPECVPEHTVVDLTFNWDCMVYLTRDFAAADDVDGYGFITEGSHRWEAGVDEITKAQASPMGDFDDANPDLGTCPITADIENQIWYEPYNDFIIKWNFSYTL